MVQLISARRSGAGAVIAMYEARGTMRRPKPFQVPAQALMRQDGVAGADHAAGRDGLHAGAGPEAGDRGVLVDADARLHAHAPQAAGETGGLDGAAVGDEVPALEHGRGAEAVHVGLRQHAVVVLDAEAPGGLDGLLPAAGLRGRRGDADVAVLAEPGVHAVIVHPGGHLADGPGAGVDDGEGAVAPEQVHERAGVVVEAVDEPAVAAAGPEAALVLLEDHHLHARAAPAPGARRSTGPYSRRR